MTRETTPTLLAYYEINHPEIAVIRAFVNPEETANGVAEEIIKVVQMNPTATITYATGDTMIPVYKNLVRAANERGTSFVQTIGFHLDEYYPCEPDLVKYPYSFVGYLRERVFGPLGIERANELNGLADNPEAEAQRYDRLLTAQPVDLVILGIGPWSNKTQSGCHIAFNESGTPFNSRTHVAQLSRVTIERDRVQRGQDTPERALTQGIANILEARQILLVAYGKNKGQSLREALYGEIGIQRPASVLRTQGQKARIFIDQAAASSLRNFLSPKEH